MRFEELMGFPGHPQGALGRLKGALLGHPGDRGVRKHVHRVARGRLWGVYFINFFD